MFLQLWRGSVGFAMHPQHQHSLDSGVNVICEDAKEAPRKRPRSLSLLSLNSSDWNSFWETKTSPLMNIEQTIKRIKLEQFYQ